jgi:hypothetical protein
MRRLLAVLAAALLLPLPAATASGGGEVVITADGPAYTTIDLPAEVALDPDAMTVTTSSAYVHVAVHQDGQVPMQFTRYPDGNWFMSGAALPAGPANLVVYTDGPAELRMPAPGTTGTLAIDAESPLAATQVVRNLLPDANGTVESDIPFTVPPHAFVLHAVDRPAQNHLLERTTFCTAPAGDPCSEAPLPVPLPGGTSRWDVYTTAPASGDVHGYYRSTTIGDGGPAVHTVVVMPLP